MATVKSTEGEIVLPELKKKKVNITLVGDSQLVQHKWSEKAKQEMRDKQQKAAKQAREAKDPERDFRQSLYTMPDGSGYCFPSIAFKAAAVTACSHIAGITKVVARGAFHIQGDFVKIDGPDPVMREDMVRVGMGTADLRYRGEFHEWKVSLPIVYNANIISLPQLLNLFNTAGFAVGVGEYRPERDGSWGMFHVDSCEEVG